MDRPTERLMSGWLIKSPPEKQMNRKFMPANWKRRYFVLQEAVSDLPGPSASLLYYKDEKCRQPKGCIDLEHCEEVLSTLDSPNYPYLFALKTVHKKKNEARTYYLATDSQSEMNQWVDKLCIVLGLKETEEELAEERPTPVPAPRYQPDPSPIAIPPPIQSIPTRPPLPALRKGEEYIPLETCFSGQNDADDENLSSVPEDVAPPRPHSTEQVEYDTPVRQVDRNDNVYKMPRARNAPNVAPSPQPRPTTKVTSTASHDSVYKYPPKRDPPEYINQDDMDSEDAYKMPPPYHHSTYDSPPSAHLLKREPSERDSNSSNGSKHSHLCTDDSGLGSSMDNLSKGVRDLKTSHQQSQEVYDYPPSKQVSVRAGEAKKLLESVPPPAQVDPKPKETNRAQYVNLNEPNPPEVQYDFPPPSSSRKRTDAELLGLHPPVPVPCSSVVTAHQYVNAGVGVVQVASHMRTPHTPPKAVPPHSPARTAHKSYLPMNKAAAQHSNSPDAYPGMHQSSPDAYLGMQQAASSPDAYLGMQQAASSPDAYLAHSPQDSYLPMQQTDSYIPMNRTDSSYLPMANQRLLRGSRDSESHLGDDYLPMDKDRCSTDSTYQVLPPGVHRVPESSDYDNALVEYSLPKSNRPVPQPQERESIYAIQPSNRPVESRRGLEAYVPTSGGHTLSGSRRTGQLDMYASAPNRGESEIYDVAPSNRPVPPLVGKAASKSPILNRPLFNKERSRSFKRNLDMPVLPVSKNPAADSDSSSDEESDNDDPSSNSSHERSVDSISKPHQPPSHPKAENLKRSLNSTPPPPKKAGEIEYLDLGLENPTDKERSPVFSRSPAAAGNVTPTEYHDIDFVKTQALSDTRKDLESKRKSSSSKSVDD